MYFWSVYSFIFVYLLIALNFRVERRFKVFLSFFFFLTFVESVLHFFVVWLFCTCDDVVVWVQTLCDTRTESRAVRVFVVVGSFSMHIWRICLNVEYFKWVQICKSTFSDSNIGWFDNWMTVLLLHPDLFGMRMISIRNGRLKESIYLISNHMFFFSSYFRRLIAKSAIFPCRFDFLPCFFFSLFGWLLCLYFVLYILGTTFHQYAAKHALHHVLSSRSSFGLAISIQL